MINGRQQLGRLSVPYSVSGGSPSTDQIAQLEWYAAKVATWQAASTEDKATWNALGGLTGISGFNYLLTVLPPAYPDRGLVWTNPVSLSGATYVTAVTYLLSLIHI